MNTLSIKHGLLAHLARSTSRRPTLLFAGADIADLVWRIAPVFDRAMVVVLLDQDADALRAAFEQLADDAEQRGIVATWPGKVLLLHLPSGALRIEAAALDVITDNAVRRLRGEALVSAGGLPMDARDLPRVPLVMFDLPIAAPTIWPPLSAPWLRLAWRGDVDRTRRAVRALRAAGWSVASETQTVRQTRRDRPALIDAIDRVADGAQDLLARSASAIAQWRQRRVAAARNGRLILQWRILLVLAAPPLG